MTAWQDEQGSGPFGGDQARPLSRRAAREAERRAAEGRPDTMLEKPPHPSGVVDFEAHDFSGEFTPDQDFAVGDTQDIWAALTRGARPGPQGDADVLRAARDSGAMPETMDRVREALLRRREQADPAATEAMPQQRAAAFDSGSFGSRLLDAPQPEPRTEPAAGVSRRERRRLEEAGQREDGLPADLFAQRAAQAIGQGDWDEYAEYERAAEQSGQDGYDDRYYDEPYAPEPTIAIPVRGTASQPERAGTDPVALPQSFVEPVGDDRLTFSSPAPILEPHDYAAVDADPEFIQPGDDEWEDDEDDVVVDGPRPASAPVSFLAPQRAAAFDPGQVGPPSELTDLAGFEALIRKARQQPQPQAKAPAAPPRPVAWADDEEVQEGFGSLLSRQVQSSHGTSPALILPSDPQPVDLTQAVNGTGDIFTTGTMRLSNRFAATGASEDHYDSHEIDRLYDASQDEPAAGVAPVRASRAVSGAAQNRVVAGRPSRGNLLPTVLAIVAGAMAVGVVTLLVGSWVFKIF